MELLRHRSKSITRGNFDGSLLKCTAMGKISCHAQFSPSSSLLLLEPSRPRSKHSPSSPSTFSTSLDKPIAEITTCFCVHFGFVGQFFLGTFASFSFIISASHAFTASSCISLALFQALSSIDLQTVPSQCICSQAFFSSCTASRFASFLATI